MRLQVLLLLFVIHVLSQAGAELFTSNAHLQRALFAEKDIAHLLKDYVKQEEARLERIQKLAEDFESHSNTALSDTSSYLGNPVNAFLLIKRFTLDWDKTVSPVISNSTWDNMFQELQQTRSDLPTFDDLKGAASALMRLQDTYQLDTSKVAHGNLAGIKSPILTEDECYELGRLAYNQGDFYHTTLWMEQALEKRKKSMQRTGEGGDKKCADVLDFLAFSYFKALAPIIAADECFLLGRLSYMEADYYHSSLWMQAALEREDKEMHKSIRRTDALDYLSYDKAMMGNVPQALDLTNELLSIDPYHERATNNKVYFEAMMADPNSQEKITKQEAGKEYQANREEYRNSDEFLNYEALCRGEDIQPLKDAHKFTCRYVTNNHPLLILQPAKEETQHLDPWLVIYHDVLTDEEIDTIKRLATPRLNRATVQNAKTGALETANYRISKSAWLRNEESELIQRVNDRMQAITGLDMDTAEELQVANYGLGGHYEPHFDFARRKAKTYLEKLVGNRIATFLVYKEEKDAFKSLGTGNRIATFLNYLSDVEAGGATVFPYIGLKLFPKKGRAAFWYNLYRNGDGIYNTRHAACPVLVGTKWVANKWIHERGQEFRRQCGVDPDE